MEGHVESVSIARLRFSELRIVLLRYFAFSFLLLLIHVALNQVSSHAHIALSRRPYPHHQHYTCPSFVFRISLFLKVVFPTISVELHYKSHHPFRNVNITAEKLSGL